MKFQCDRCKTRYSIADDKVRGKVLKIRCKNCETVITIREGMETPVGVSGSTMAFPAVTGQMPTPAALAKAPAPAARGGFGGDDEATRVSSAPEMPRDGGAPPGSAGWGGAAQAAPSCDEWFVSVDGNQEGPFTLAQARERVAKKRPPEEMHAWKDDFADWLPVDKVRELAPYLPKRPAPPPPPRPQPRPSAAVPAVVAPQPSTPVTIAPRGQAVRHDPAPAHAPAPAAKPVFDFSLPAVSAPHAAPSTPAASSPPVDQAAGDGLDLHISEPSRVARLHPPGKNGSRARDSLSFPAARDSMSFPAAMAASAASMSMSIPVQRKHPVLLYLAGLIAIIAIVTVAIVIIASRKHETAAHTPAGGGASSDYIADVYKGGKVAPDRAVPTIEMPTQTPTPDPVKRPTNVVKTSKPTNGGGTTVPDPLGKEETFPTGTDREEPIEPLSPDDVSAVYRANEAGLKWCYERALKADPMFRMNKINVTISIAKSGVVSEISMPDQSSTLGTCLTSRIRAWRFRKSTEGLNMQFDIMFARRE